MQITHRISKVTWYERMFIRQVNSSDVYMYFTSNIDWNFEQNPLLFKLARENSRHFTSSPRTSEKRAQKFYTDDKSLLWSLWKILRSFFTRHFAGKHATGGVAKCWLFFKAIFKLASNLQRLEFRLGRSCVKLAFHRPNRSIVFAGVK